MVGAEEALEVGMPSGDRLQYRLLSLPLYLAELVQEILAEAQAPTDPE